MSKENPEAMRALDVLSPDLENIINGSGPTLGVGPPPMPVPGLPTPKSTAEAKAAANKTNQQTLADAASVRGVDNMAVRKFPALSKILPGADRIRIRQRKDDGSLATVGNYNKTDVDGVGDIETFIQHYLVPKHGGGEYDIAIIDSQNKEWPSGIVKIMEPPKYPTAGAGVAASDANSPLMVEMFRHMTKPQPPPPDPLTQIRNAKEFLMEMSPKSSGASESMFASMMQMQMQMQQAAQAQAAQAAQAQAAAQAENMKMFMAMMTTKPAIDPSVAALLERMDRRLEKLESTPPMPPPPPMMAQEPAYKLPELLTAVGGLVTSVLPLIKGEGGPSAVEMANLIINAQQAARPTDGLGVRDVIDIFKEREANASPPATLEEQIGTLVRVKELAAAVAPPPAPPSAQGTTFWDAAINILGPGSEISRTLARRVDEAAPPRQVVITDNRPAPLQPVPHRQIAEQAPVQPTQQPAAEEETIQLPANFGEKMAAMASASSAGERVGATVDALLSLQPIQRWQPFLQGLLGSIAMNPTSPHEAMRSLGGWLKVMMNNGHVTREVSMATLAAFAENYAIVRAGVVEKIPAIRSMAQQADAAEAAAKAQAAQQAAPQPAAPPTSEGVVAPTNEASSDDSEEDSDEKPTGPAPAVLDMPDSDVANYAGGY